MGMDAVLQLLLAGIHPLDQLHGALDQAFADGAHLQHSQKDTVSKRQARLSPAGESFKHVGQTSALQAGPLLSALSPAKFSPTSLVAHYPPR